MFQPDMPLMFFHAYIDHSSDFTNVHFSVKARYFINSCRTEWKSSTFRTSQDCSIFLECLKIIRMLCLFKILLIWSVVPFTYERIERLFLFNFSCGCYVFEFFVLLLCLLIVLFIYFLLYSFRHKVCFK